MCLRWIDCEGETQKSFFEDGDELGAVEKFSLIRDGGQKKKLLVGF